MMERWGAFVARRALAILLAGVALVIGAGAYGFGVFDHLAQGGFDDPDSESARELALERETFGNRTVDVVAIYSSDELTAKSPDFRAEVEETLADIPADSTSSVVSYYDTKSPDMVSKDGHAVQVQISLAGASQDDLLDNWDEVEPALESENLETDLAGSFAVYGDVNEISSEDLERAEMISLPIVILLALLIFGSLVAASMPALVGALAVVGSLALVRLLTTFTDVSIFSVNVISLLGMGLAIDYALFMISRFREELARLPMDDPDASTKAITTTMVTAGRTVLFSGLTVAAAMSSLLVFPQIFLRSMGYGGISAVVIAMLAALTVLPATLRLLGRRIDAGRMPWRRHRPVAVDDDHGWWARLAHARHAEARRDGRRGDRSAPGGRVAVPRRQVGQRRLPRSARRRLGPRRRRQAERRVRSGAVHRQPPAAGCRPGGRRVVHPRHRGGRRHRRRPAGSRPRATPRCCARSGTATARASSPRTS